MPTVNYELELLNESFDETAQTHILHLQLVELDADGNEVARGERHQRSFCLPGEADDVDFKQILSDLKQELAGRYEKTKRHKTSLDSAVNAHLRKAQK